NIAQQICLVLQKNEIQSVLIEGGTQTLQTFIDENLWDEARVFRGNIAFKEGVFAPILKARIQKENNIQKDVLNIYTND
ncbi:MAG: bifunctional diaminohydroxyphosphoribosylaminopyrimidine deaminase/5-amino-6-(5-phosphoribosylamino)uracil reductase RibD, partial [Polaribacter sp.]